MTEEYLELVEGIKSGDIVPFLGPEALSGVVHSETQAPIPADSDSLILAMNEGRPMAPRLMYEFSRAAMNLENKKGRKFIEKFLTSVYGDPKWSESAFHRWLSELNAPYIIDLNRDVQLQNMMSDKPHTLIIGVARLAAHPYRFDIFEFRDGKYNLIALEQVDKSLPVLFKPLGSPLPTPSFIASDADFVDYITELMGGFAIPDWIKEHRKKKQYLFLGMRFTRDTERMVMSDIIYAASELAGWAFIENPTDKEKRFLAKKNVQIINADCSTLMDYVKGAVA